MARHDRQRQQHFIFDQRHHRQLPAGRNRIEVVGLQILIGLLGIRWYQQQPVVYNAVESNLGQTTLAMHHQSPTNFQVQAKLHSAHAGFVRFAITCEFAIQPAFPTCQHIMQACQVLQGKLAGNTVLYRRKFEAVDDHSSEIEFFPARHKR